MRSKSNALLAYVFNFLSLSLVRALFSVAKWESGARGRGGGGGDS